MKLQSQRVVTPQELAKHFGLSKRTIYRDIAALEEAGVPLVSEEGSYSLVDGYSIPPVMFTESEANALIVAEKFIAKTKDASLIVEFGKAIEKIRSVLRHEAREKANFLGDRTIIGKNWHDLQTSGYLSEIQQALTERKVLELDYQKKEASIATPRQVEPFAIYHNMDENWVLIAWCRLRKDFRSFRLDRMEGLKTLAETFPPHEMTLDEYVEMQRLAHESRMGFDNSPK